MRRPSTCWNRLRSGMTWSAGRTAITPVVERAPTRAAPRVTAAQVSRPTGSAMMFAGGSPASCRRTSAAWAAFVMTRMFSSGTMVGPGPRPAGGTRISRRAGDELLGSPFAADRPEPLATRPPAMMITKRSRKGFCCRRPVGGSPVRELAVIRVFGDAEVFRQGWPWASGKASERPSAAAAPDRGGCSVEQVFVCRRSSAGGWRARGWRRRIRATTVGQGLGGCPSSADAVDDGAAHHGGIAMSGDRPCLLGIGDPEADGDGEGGVGADPGDAGLDRVGRSVACIPVTPSRDT
jgi:hypothetical protein